MAAYRVCSECGGSLEGKAITAKTCKTQCRTKRSRRLKRVRKTNGEANAMPPNQKEISEMVNGVTPEVAHSIVEEELRPIVRESITADTLQAISDMVALTPLGVQALKEDLSDEDKVVRQRAYTLLMKYTVGHNAIVQPPEQDKGQPLQVNFNLPRPDDYPGEDTAPAIEGEAEELKECDTCHKVSGASNFVAGSDRCSTCFADQQAQLALLNADD